MWKLQTTTEVMKLWWLWERDIGRTQTFNIIIIIIIKAL
jgi:hypothetical protein